MFFKIFISKLLKRSKLILWLVLILFSHTTLICNHWKFNSWQAILISTWAVTKCKWLLNDSTESNIIANKQLAIVAPLDLRHFKRFNFRMCKCRQWRLSGRTAARAWAFKVTSRKWKAKTQFGSLSCRRISCRQRPVTSPLQTATDCHWAVWLLTGRVSPALLAASHTIGHRKEALTQQLRSWRVALPFHPKAFSVFEAIDLTRCDTFIHTRTRLISIFYCSFWL